MPLIDNVGGSITGVLVLLATALSMRLLRLRQRAEQAAGGEGLQRHSVTSISIPALRILVETRPVPHAVLVMRSAADTHICTWLQCKDAIVLPVTELHGALSSAQGWDACMRARGCSAQRPPRHQLVVLVADSDAAAQQAAGLAAACGYHCCMSVAVPPPVARDGLHQTAHYVEYLSSNGLACLLHRGAPCIGSDAAATAPTCVVDVRRHDERALYGSIPGSLHLPVHDLPRALSQLGAQAFAAQFDFRKPSHTDVVVLVSRTTCRAVWASQLCRDAGYRRVYVSQHGTYGWHMDASVKAYRHYELGEVPPDPDVLKVDPPDLLAGELELHRLGLGTP